MNPKIDPLFSQHADFQVSREMRLSPSFLIVDGTGRSGKSSFCGLAASLERIEMERIEMLFDYMANLHGMGKLTHDGAVAVMRLHADVILYEHYIGRDLNCRWSDASSIFQSAHPWRYLRRLFVANDRPRILREIERDRPILMNHCHDQLRNVALHFATHEDLYFVEMRRHPVDLVLAWWRRGFGNNLCGVKEIQALCVRKGNDEAYFLAQGWEADYRTLSPVDRIIRIIEGVYSSGRKAYEDLCTESRQRVLLLNYEQLAVDPLGEMERAADLLKSRTTKKTAKMIRKLGFPRQIVEGKRKSACRELQENCSTDGWTRLAAMIQRYEETGWTA